jgi:hypothetical protein
MNAGPVPGGANCLSEFGTTRTSLDALFRVALGGRVNIECVCTNSKSMRSCIESVSAKLVRLYGTERTQMPLWDPFVSKLVPHETHGSSKLGGGSGFRPRILKSLWPSAPEP